MSNALQGKLKLLAFYGVVLSCCSCAELDRRPDSFDHAINRAVMSDSMQRSAEVRGRGVRPISASGLSTR